MPNFSILSIPAYYGVVFGAHLYAQSLVKKAQKMKPAGGQPIFDNTNPRSASAKENLQKNMPPKMFGRWERSKAAHNNGLESFPLFAVVTFAAHQAGLRENTQNIFGLVGVGLRVAYTLLYINIESQKLSLLRTLTWGAGMLVALYQGVHAGLSVAGLVDY